MALLALQMVYRYHATMWMEGVWEIVGARESPTKFLLTDEPVTFYNAGAFPGSKVCTYPSDVGLEKLGTRTIFPLSREACLIVTHLQFAQDPRVEGGNKRVNARAYQYTVTRLMDIQFGRELEGDEVLRINLILKQRATRYIAAANQEWLYPERRASTAHWSKIDGDWFLLPNPYLAHYGGTVFVGYKGGGSWGMDEYGRPRGHPDFEKKVVGWGQYLEARAAWAAKRIGRSHARTAEHAFSDEFLREDLELYGRPRAHRERGRTRAR